MSKELAAALDSEILTQKFQQVAPDYMVLESEKTFAVEIVKDNQQLRNVAQTNPLSIQAALAKAASVGLSLNPTKKQAYLICRSMKIKDESGRDKWINKACLEPSYMGLCDLATMSGAVDWIQARIVYESDSFVDNGVGMKPTHTRDPFAKDRGEIKGVYCVAKAGGDYLTETMSYSDVIDIRDRSDGWKAYVAKKIKSCPWSTDFAEQAKKTVVRRAYKMWPKCKGMDRIAEAVHISNENEGFEPIMTSPAQDTFTADQKNEFDRLISSGDAIGLFCFRESFGDPDSPGWAVWSSLGNSFDHGQKTKQGQVMRDLVNSGRAQFDELQMQIEDYARSDDEMGIKQEWEDLSQPVRKLLLDRIDAEVRHILVAEMKLEE